MSVNFTASELGAFWGRKHAEIVNFWIQKMNWWTGPTDLAFWQVYRLHGLRDLHEHPDAAVDLMFSWEGKTDYETMSKLEFGMHEVGYRWSGRANWVTELDFTFMGATKLTAMKVLRIVLGRELEGLIQILKSENYTGVNLLSLYAELWAKIGRYIFTPTFNPGFVEYRRSYQRQEQVAFAQPIFNSQPRQPLLPQPPVNPNPPSHSFPNPNGAERSLIPTETGLLNLTGADLNKMTSERRSDVLFKFWISRRTARDNFPRVFNLFKSRNIREGNAMHNLRLIFGNNDANKSNLLGLSVKASTTCVLINFIVNGVQKSVFHPVTKTVKDAENAGAWKAMEMSLGKKERELICHVSKSYFWVNVDVEKLLKRIEDHAVLIRGTESAVVQRQKQAVQTITSGPAESCGGLPLTFQPPLPKTPSAAVPPQPPNTPEPVVSDSATRGRPVTTEKSAVNREQVLQRAQTKAAQKPPHPRSQVTPELFSQPARPRPQVTPEVFARPAPPRPVPRVIASPSSRLNPGARVLSNRTARNTRAPPPPRLPPPYVKPIVDVYNEFADFFSCSDDGTTPILDSVLEKCSKLQKCLRESSPEVEVLNQAQKDCPYLPFGELIGYHLPEEAAEGLQILFQGRLEAGPAYESTKNILATVHLNSGEIFQAVGTTEEEAKNKAAKEALTFLKSLEET